MDSVSVTLPVDLVKKLVGAWYLIKQHESKAIREACKEALDERYS